MATTYKYITRCVRMRQSIRKSEGHSYVPYKNPLIQVPKQSNSLHQPQQAGTQLCSYSHQKFRVATKLHVL